MQSCARNLYTFEQAAVARVQVEVAALETPPMDRMMGSATNTLDHGCPTILAAGRAFGPRSPEEGVHAPHEALPVPRGYRGTPGNDRCALEACILAKLGAFPLYEGSPVTFDAEHRVTERIEGRHEKNAVGVEIAIYTPLEQRALTQF